MSSLLRRPWLGPFLALVATYVLFVAIAPDTFATTANLVTMARQTVVVAILSVGMTFIIVHGGIDLSVGSTVALMTVTIALLRRGGASGVAAASASIAFGALLGLVVGLLITSLRMAPFIITLGAMSILRGAAKGLADEQKIDADPGSLGPLLGMSRSALPPGVWIAIAVIAAGAFLLHATRFGKHVFAIGSSESAARLCGVPVARTKVLVYALAGALAGLAGILEFSKLTVGDPTDSYGLELEVIAAVVVGGASLSGGEGAILGSLAGACLMTVIRTGSTHVRLPSWVHEILTGVIIVVAVAIDRARHRRRS